MAGHFLPRERAMAGRSPVAGDPRTYLRERSGMRVLSEMRSVGAHPYGPGRDVVAGQELESGHCGVPAARARRCADSTVATDWRAGGPSSALLPNYECTPSTVIPRLCRGRRPGRTSARPANATLASARIHCVSATRGPLRPLAVSAQRKPGGTMSAGSISSG